MSSATPSADSSERKPMTLSQLHEMRAGGEPIAMLTCYDASFAALLDDRGLDGLLIGDSLGMVVQGERSTLSVTVEQIAYHTRCVAQGARRAWIVADLPAGSVPPDVSTVYAHASALMRAGAQMVKIEGGAWAADVIMRLVERGIPVCGHLGLTPQSVHQLGGYRVQARGEDGAERLLADALALQAAGIGLLVLELIPATLAARVTQALKIPTIGIGAGAECSGQILVLHDMLDVYPGRKPRFVRNFMQGQTSIRGAIDAYVAAVKARAFPTTEHTY